MQAAGRTLYTLRTIDISLSESLLEGLLSLSRSSSVTKDSELFMDIVIALSSAMVGILWSPPPVAEDSLVLPPSLLDKLDEALEVLVEAASLQDFISPVRL